MPAVQSVSGLEEDITSRDEAVQIFDYTECYSSAAVCVQLER